MGKLKLGVTGAPGGATHYAARLLGIGHESANQHGICDYLLAVPAEYWPNPSAQNLRRTYPKKAYRLHTSFSPQVTVIRHPLSVVNTNLYLRGLGFIKSLGGMVGLTLRQNPETDVSYTTRIILAWYAQCLEWSDGKFFTAEGPASQVEHLKTYPGKIFEPGRTVGHKKGKRVSHEALQQALSPELLKDVNAFVDKYYGKKGHE